MQLTAEEKAGVQAQTKHLNKVVRNMLMELTGIDETCFVTPGGTVVRPPRGKLAWHYWEDRVSRWMFGYTSFPDQNGDYWTVVYQPIGLGSRSRPHRWKLHHWSKARHLKTARQRAYNQFRTKTQAALRKHAKPTQDDA